MGTWIKATVYENEQGDIRCDVSWHPSEEAARARRDGLIFVWRAAEVSRARARKLALGWVL